MLCGWAGLAESNGSLPPGGRLTVTCRLTACTPGSAPGPTLGVECGKFLPFFYLVADLPILLTDCGNACQALKGLVFLPELDI